jgi:hypothetical protein
VAVDAGLDPPDRLARMVAPGVDERGPAAPLRREFAVDGEVISARLYATVSRPKRPYCSRHP